jgi:ATP-dependent Lhr-like helicase
MAELPDQTRVVYVSPLKALSNDIQRNLELPLAGIREALAAGGHTDVAIRTLVRTGDTPATVRAAMRRHPPHIVVTTPESLYLLLTSDGGRRMLATTRTVIVDEIHALAANKRGCHLALSLERLEALAGPDLVRIGLSATQHPIEEIACFLVGAENPPFGKAEKGGMAGTCSIVDTGYVRARDLAIELPRSPLEAVMSTEVKEEVYDRLAELIGAHRTTLVFVNTRRMAERVTRHLGERIGEEHIASHHGSLAKEQRLRAEQRLKAGELRALVATASLELGIDIGEVDLVCQLGSTRTIATFLQRVGRSGHAVGGLPKGRLFPLSRDELVECAALLDAVRRGELDRVIIPEYPLDVLAQQVVAMVACEEWGEDALFERVRRAYPYRHLARADFDAVVCMLAEGFTTRRGRRGAYLHHDAVNARLRGRRGARLVALTNGGVIPDNADYEVVVEPAGTFIGTLNEDFAVESLPGDIFQLGNASWRVLKIETGRVRVEDAHGQPPSIPFWFGEAPARSDELSAAVSRLRETIAVKLGIGSLNLEAALSWLVAEVSISRAAAEQIVDYLAATRAALGLMPTQDTLVLERFFDESGGMQLVIHAPLGNRINRAWGLALRKRFCRKFNFELQAAASEDAIVLSLGHTHSFPLDEVVGYLSAATVREVLVQALLDAPMFAVRWRWVSTCALAVPRFRGGRKLPARLQRMDAEDLVSVVFPDQRACLENVAGQRELPDHPLVHQTLRDCLTEAMDIEGLQRLLDAIERGAKRVVARDVTEPSPLAHEVLAAGPYYFLDDAPLEERRTLAVQSRRWLDPETATDLGRLDPQAIARVRAEAWPEAVNADELHDALILLGFMTTEEGQRGPGWPGFFRELAGEGRAAVLGSGDQGLWVAAERLPELSALFPGALVEPPISAPASLRSRSWTREEALVEVLRGRLEGLGPTSASALADAAGLPQAEIEQALRVLEAEGFVLRGQFTPDAQETQWCERRLLARIHRQTLNRLRQEIEPVTAADLMRFLFAWQHLSPGYRLEGPQGLAGIVEQLEGFEAPAAAWESEILPARIEDYDASWLDGLCLCGKVTWLRLTPPKLSQDRGRGPSIGPVRATPIALVSRKHLPAWSACTGLAQPGAQELRPSPLAQHVAEYLQAHGASFFEELVEGTRLLYTQVEDALGELVAWGLVTADSFTGLRALLVPSAQRRPIAGARRRVKTVAFGVEDAGRWVSLRRSEADRTLEPEQVERLARILLRRYGVVFRRLVEREPLLPPWRDLLRLYRRLEARGEIRGGHFVGGFAGEQYALVEAVGMLRDIRRKAGAGEMVSMSAADPLNLVGIVTPGPRVPALTGNRVLYRDGVPIAVQVAKEMRFLARLDVASEWQARNVLIRRRVAPKLRSSLGHGG